MALSKIPGQDTPSALAEPSNDVPWYANRTVQIVGGIAFVLAAFGIAGYFVSGEKKPATTGQAKKAAKKGKKSTNLDEEAALEAKINTMVAKEKAASEGPKVQSTVSSVDPNEVDGTPQRANIASPKEEPAQKPLESMTIEERLELAKQAKTRGNKYFDGKRYDKAIELYTEGLRLTPEGHPTSSIFYSNRAACYAALNDLSKVIEDTNAALKLDPKYIKALLRRAHAYESLKQLRESLYDYTAVCFLSNFSNEQCMTAVDRVLKVLGKQVAEEFMKTREQKLPSSFFITAYLESYRGNLNAFPSLNEGESTATEESTDGEHIFRSAVSLLKSKKYDEAAALLNRSIEAGSHAHSALAYNLRGTFRYLRGDLEGALADFNKCFELDPKSVNALIKRGSVFMEKLDAEAALKDFATAVELEPNNSDIYYHRGQVHFLMDKLPDAIADYTKSLDLDKSIPYAFVQLAVAQYRVGNVSEALQTFKQAENLFPNSADIYNYHGEVLLDQQQFPEAVRQFDKAISLVPTTPLSFINKGLALLQWKEDIESAVKYVQKAIEIDPRCDVAYAHLAQLSLHQRNIQEAIASYTKAAELTRTEAEMANICACREAAAAQLHVIETLGISAVGGVGLQPQ